MKRKKHEDYLISEVCPVCQQVFEHLKSAKRKTCSKECKYILHNSELKKKRFINTCKQCGKEFEVPKSLKQRECCSNECRHKLHSVKLSQKIIKNCEHCGKEFQVQPSHKNQRCCSWDCYLQITITRKQKKAQTKECPVCQKKIPLYRTCCSVPCMATYYETLLIGENNPNWKGGKWRPNGVQSHIRKKILKRDNYTCQECYVEDHRQTPSILHVHHIIPHSEGGKENVENLITLCLICHWIGKHGFSLNQSMREIASRTGCGSRYL